MRGRRVGGIDSGFRNPFATVWGALDRDNIVLCACVKTPRPQWWGIRVKMGRKMALLARSFRGDMPTAQFNKNRESFPLDELAKYEGKWVAFSPDGTKIVAADADLLALDQHVRDAGFNPSDVCFESVPNEDDGEIFYGGGLS